MYKLLLLLPAIIFLPFCSMASGKQLHGTIDPKLVLLKQQVIRDILSGKPNEKEAAELAASIKADGSWADIDYTDKTRGGWTVADHLQRLNNMALAYKQPGTVWTGNNALQKKIISGLNYWLSNDFICPNWWYPQIGVPKALAPLMLLLEDSLSTAQMQAGVKILERAKIGMTGQNKVWLSGNVIYRSLLTGDVAAVEAAVKAIQDEVVVSEGEGIQADYSYHQHGTQQQFGNYGSAYAGDMLKWASIFQGTPFQFEAAKIAILRSYLLQGMRWILWKDKMDISACGRQLFPHAQTSKANGIRNILKRMPQVDAAFASDYANAMNDFSGNKHFWKSDMTVHRRNNFYASVKMSSTRVGGAESCNEENIQGYHLGDGATWFYQSNEEYTDIFPFWDWKMIPGTTAFHDAAPLPVLPCSGYNIPSHFVGGVTNGTNGIATLAYIRDGITAQKSWFFFDDVVICLGAGIQSNEDKELRTTINQSFLQGDVLVNGTAQPAGNGVRSLVNASYVLHDGWGYYFPGKATVEISKGAQEGNWHHVLKRMPDTTMTANIFTLWFNHHTKPAADKYAYYVLPAATAANISQRAGACTVTTNTAALQIAENSRRQIAGLVFAQPGTATTRLAGKVGTDKPCVLLLEKKFATLHVSLAEPTHTADAILLTLPGNRKCSTAITVFNKVSNSTQITIALPQGPDAGKSVQLIIQ